MIFAMRVKTAEGLGDDSPGREFEAPSCPSKGDYLEVGGLLFQVLAVVWRLQGTAMRATVYVSRYKRGRLDELRYHPEDETIR